jgi:cholesterol oxidase
MNKPSASRDSRPPLSRTRFAQPAESFLAEHPEAGARACDVLVVGSGYGGSFAALELAAEHRRVWVFERGREFVAGEFAETLGELPGHVQFTSAADGVPRGYRDALFDLRIDDDAMALVGCGLGGGSLINAGVFLEPRDAVLDDPRWPHAIRADREALRHAYAWARTVIGVAPFETPERFPKYRALEQLARAIPEARVTAAPIAVAGHDGTSAVGVERRACIACGNCVTGCNYGSKNTLHASAIPLAAERGARFWTGAQAVRVSRAPPGARVPGSGAPARWVVRFERIATLGPGHDRADAFEVLADVVVIAAGALGSAELLMRSKSDTLPMPATLGRRFSGNGDLLSFGWGQRTPVHAVARPDDAAAGRPQVGPTIVGVIDTLGAGTTPGSLPRDAVLQEGAVPAGMAPLIGTLLSAAGTVQSMTNPRAPSQRAWAEGGDPAAVRDDLPDRTQVLLAMGRDGATGSITLEGPAGAARPRLRFSLGYASADPTIAGIEAALEHAGRAGGFDGGFHMPNPAWRLLPASAESIFGSTDRRLVTVHPIGGCVMGEHREAGAVDDVGCVFDPTSPDPCAVHDGLHVLDGAILPGALGVNPMATIAAVSIRAARRIARALDAQAGRRLVAPPAAGPWAVRVRPRVDGPQGLPVRTADGVVGAQVPVAAAPVVQAPVVQAPVVQAPVVPARVASTHVASTFVATPPGTRLGFTEALLTEPGEKLPLGALAPIFDALQPPLQGGTVAALQAGHARLALHIEASIDPWRWVADPALAWTGGATLSVVNARGEAPGGIERTVLRGTCTLHLLRADPPGNPFTLAWRLIGSLRAFVTRRPGGRFLAELARTLREQGARAAWDSLGLFMRALRMHTTHRTLDYSVTLPVPGGSPLVLQGGKRLAYTSGARNVWDALLRLDLQPTRDGLRGAPWAMRVDVLDLLARGPYQLRGAPDTPHAVAVMSAVGALWLRALAQTHYWSLRGPDQDAPNLRPLANAPLSALRLADGTRVDPEPFPFSVPRTEHSAERLTLRLSRYRAPSNDRRTARGPMLFIHGLAHGGEVYTTSSVDCPMAACFVDAGWDVWVLDHRLSNLLGDTPRQASTIDDVAACDIPGAFMKIEAVLQTQGTPASDGIRVFAHCVGAAALSIAVLSARLTRADGRSRISGLVMHAVHPWTVPSRWNRVSASLAAFYRDVVGDQVLDPLPGSPPGGMDQVIDRLAASIPWEGTANTIHLADARRRGEDPADHERYGDLICNRMTLFYGREWDHDNLDPRTHSRLHELVGPAHLSVFKHLFYILRRQRLTDAHGRNAYLSQQALGEHWTFPTLFATGRANGVFDPASAARSFLAMSLLRRKVPTIGRSGLYLPDGIGHMDFLFGRHNGTAATGVENKAGAGLQATLCAFIDDPHGWLDAREATHGAADRLDAVRLSPQVEVDATPWVGPMLRYTLEPTRFELEVWIELRPFRSARVQPAPGSDWEHEPLGDALPGDFRRLSWACDLPGDGPPPEIPHPYVDAGVDMDPDGLEAADDWDAAPDLRELSDAYMARRVAITDSWSRAPWLRHLFELRAAGDHTPRTITFLLGSCRWPGLAFERGAAAAPIAAMNARVKRAAPTIDALLLLGDQVYVDATADLFDTGIPEERASQRYREAFSGESLADERLPSPEMATLLASLPTWTVVDDHEFGDDWPGASATSALPAGLMTPLPARFREGFGAALAYQWRGLRVGTPPQTPSHDGDRVTRGFWFPFEAATLRCFALDARTERTRRSAASWATDRIMGAAQHAALASWLASGPKGATAAPRLMLCGSPIGLPRASELDGAAATALRADDWHGYPASCRELLRAVLACEGAPVVLLCGDPHYSCVVEVEIEDRVGPVHRRGRLIVVVASGLNTTLPFANGSPRELARGPVRLPFSDDAALVAHARVLGAEATVPRHFTQLGVQRDAAGHWSLEVEQVDEHGAAITALKVPL